ncbi:MAG TPA: class I SAM-dependent methyltransferase [Steroidobacter sp.]
MHLGTDLYYRLLYGRSWCGAEPLERLMRSWERGRRGDVPLSRAAWESQYRHGHWDLLADTRELARYSVLAGYVLLYPRARVLDVGCGDGLLALRLNGSYQSYLGIDLSETAIERARARVPSSRARFLQANAETRVPSGRFDVIVFNESLYYFERPLAVFDRYASRLADGGAIALSMYCGSARARALLARLVAAHAPADRTLVRNGDRAWECCLFASFPSALHSRERRAA